MEIVVYGRSVPVCPYCVKMKEVLDKKGVNYTYKDIDDNMDEFLELGVRTVPQCVVNGVNFGGFDQIMSILKEIKS